MFFFRPSQQKSSFRHSETPIFLLESWPCHTKFMCMNIRAFQKSHKYHVSGCKTKNYPRKNRGTRKGAVSAGYLVFCCYFFSVVIFFCCYFFFCCGCCCCGCCCCCCCCFTVLGKETPAANDGTIPFWWYFACTQMMHVRWLDLQWFSSLQGLFGDKSSHLHWLWLIQNECTNIQNS